MRAWRHAFALRAAALDRTIGRVRELFEGEPFLFLKGSDYRFRLYPETGLRPMQDVDVLVPAPRADAVTARLEALGLTRSFPAGAVARLPSYHERVFSLEGVTVEVHHSFVQRLRYRIDYDGVWARRAALGGGPAGSERLGDADAILYHAISLANDEFATPLIRFLDFWLLCRRSAAALGEAAARAPRWRAQRALYGALRQTGRVFPDFETPEVRRIEARLLPAQSRWLLDRTVLPRDDERFSTRLSRPRQLWRKFWLVSGFARRAAFFAYHAYALGLGAWLARRARHSPPAPPPA